MEKIFQKLKIFLRNQVFSSPVSLVKLLDEIESHPLKEPFYQEVLNQAKQAIERGDSDPLLLQRYVALQYRIEEKQGGLDPEVMRQDLFDFLYKQALAWKQTNPLIGSSLLTAADWNHLKTAAMYPAFIEILKQIPTLKEQFLTWVLRDGNDVIPFIEFPATVNRVIKSNLSGRISYYGPSTLRIIKDPILNHKILCLPFEGQFLSILDPSAPITFRGNYVLSIQEIFNIFASKDREVGNLEFMKEGIVNWNIHHLGYFDADQKKHIVIDIEKESWWATMPTLEVLSKKKVARRYGIDIKSKEWVVSAVATRGKPNLDYDGTHAYLEIAIPHHDGFYYVYDFGKLATEYPSGGLGRLLMLTKTVHAAVAFPDDNIFFTHRQKGFHPFILHPLQGKAIMDRIACDIRTSRLKNFVYQIESENCAKWVHLTLASVLGDKAVPDFFRMQLLDTEPEGVISHLFAWIKSLPKDWQVPILTFLHLPLGASRTIWIDERGEKVAKSLTRHSFFETGEIFLPALLIKKVMGIYLYGARLAAKNYRQYGKIPAFLLKPHIKCYLLYKGLFSPNPPKDPLNILQRGLRARLLI